MVGITKKTRREPGFLNTSPTRQKFTSASTGPVSGRFAGHPGPASASAGPASDHARLAVGRLAGHHPGFAVHLGSDCSSNASLGLVPNKG